MSFKVSVVLATRFRDELLQKCQKSLEGQAHVLETIVVHDEDANPMGCEQARNKGAEQVSAQSTHLYFTDDDCTLEPSCLEKLCRAPSGFGGSGGSVVNMSAPFYYEKVWSYIIPPMTINDEGRIVDLSDFYVEVDKWFEADHLRGGNMLVSKEAFSKVGGMSPEYGAGTIRGETDLCLKLREASYRLWFNPTARVLHYKKPRPMTEVENASDKMWRKKWQPKKFLGGWRHFAPASVVASGLRVAK